MTRSSSRRADPAWARRLALGARAARDVRWTRQAGALALLGAALARRDPRAFTRVRRVADRLWWLDRMRAAAAFDAAASAGFGFVSSWSWSHTSAGADRVLYVMLSQVTDRTVSAITYGGQAMTEIKTALQTSRYRLFRLLAPPTGANSVSITFAASTRGVGGSVSLTGVDQSTPNDTIVEELVGDASIVVASATNDMVIDFISANSVVGAYAAGPGQTLHYDTEDGGGFEEQASSREAGAASVTMSYTGGPAPNVHWGLNVNQVPPKAGLLLLLAVSHPFYVMGHGWR